MFLYNCGESVNPSEYRADIILALRPRHFPCNTVEWIDRLKLARCNAGDVSESEPEPVAAASKSSPEAGKSGNASPKLKLGLVDYTSSSQQSGPSATLAVQTSPRPQSPSAMVGKPRPPSCNLPDKPRRSSRFQGLLGPTPTHSSPHQKTMPALALADKLQPPPSRPQDKPRRPSSRDRGLLAPIPTPSSPHQKTLPASALADKPGNPQAHAANPFGSPAHPIPTPHQTTEHPSSPVQSSPLPRGKRARSAWHG